MGYVMAVLSTAAGCVASLSLLVLVMASGANSTDAQLAALKRWMVVITVGGLAVAGGAVWLAVHGRPWTGAAVGGLPVAGMIGLFIWVEATRG